MNINANMNSHNLITTRNYASQHIYNIISIRHPDLDKPKLQLKIQSIFKELINNIRHISTINELDVYNTPMSLLFQHIRPTIIQIAANCIPKVDKLFIEKGLLYNVDWCIRFYNSLKYLGARDLIIWFFLHIPYYNEDEKTILKQRETYIKILDWLKYNWTSESYFTEKEFVFLSAQTCMPYAVSYHEQNNVELLTSYSQLLRIICPFLNYYSPKLAEKVLKKRDTNTNTNTKMTSNNILIKNNISSKTRICFISDSFTTDTSVLRDRISIIGKLDRNRYDVYFASFYPFEAIKGIIAKVFMERIRSNYIYLGDSLSSARQILEKYELDYIVYPDLGMKLLPTLLAYSRIAPIQITTWGHSETSGIDTIDYFISSELFELDYKLQDRLHEDPQTHYSEKLILMKSLGTYYISPHKLFVENNEKYIKGLKTFKTREQYSFTNKDHLYVCLQTFYKLNTNFELCLARILELDSSGIILLSNTFPFCKSHLERLRKNIGIEKLKRIRWYGSLEKDEFLNLVSISDVCLDPFPFGGCNTSYDAFDYNIPVITMTGNFLHGRFTTGLYKKMDLDECIANTSDEYADIASRIGINDKLRHKINRNIEMKKHLVFQEQASVEEWNELFMSLNKTL
jgi:predicted O-linked N-acetylglucosamine transferase (SPINDLY family)